MRRPIIIYLISYILGIIVFNYTLTLNNLIIPIVVVIIYVAKNKKIINYPFLVCMIIFFIMAGISLAIEDISAGEKNKLNGIETVQKGTVFSYRSQEGKYNQEKVTFILKSDNGKKYQVKWYTKEKINQNLTGRTVLCHGIFEDPTKSRNPKTFDYNLYLKSKGIRYIINCNKIDIDWKNFKNPYLKLVNKCVSFRDNFIHELEKKQPKNVVGIQKGIMFGIKDDLEDDTYNQFQKNGTAHLLATSGLHMGIIYGLLSKLINPGIRLAPNIVIIFIMYTYVVMADFNPSIIRAFIMIVISVIGRLTCRRYDLLTASCFAGIIMLISNPYLLFSSGFQMSYLAVFIMATTVNRLNDIPIEEGWIKNLLPVIIIQILMSPYIIYNFNYFSFSSFIANPPVTFLGTGVLILVGAFMVFPVMYMEIPGVLSRILTELTQMMLAVNKLTYNDGHLTCRVKSPSPFFVLVFYGLVFLFLNEDIIISYVRNNYRRIATCIVGVFLICFLVSFQFHTGFENCNMIFIDVGNGNSMLFKSSDDKTLLVDGGGKHDYEVGIKTLMPTLLKNGIKSIDYAYISHWDTDHFKGIEEISKVGMVKNIITYEGNILRKKTLAKQMGVNIEQMHFLSRGDSFKVGKNITVKVLYPFKKSKRQYEEELAKGNENNRSLVSKVTVNDTDFLITGDIDENLEREMISKIGKDVNADIIQVPHHGSKTSSSDELLQAVSPRVAVFQCGKNNYGHPAPQIVEKYRKKGIIIYRNDLHGAIGLTIKHDDKIKIKKALP